MTPVETLRAAADKARRIATHAPTDEVEALYLAVAGLLAYYAADYQSGWELHIDRHVLAVARALLGEGQ